MMILILFSLLVLIWEYDNRMSNIPVAQEERQKTLLHRLNSAIRYGISFISTKIAQWQSGGNDE